jgi:hypothetical protein
MFCVVQMSSSSHWSALLRGSGQITGAPSASARTSDSSSSRNRRSCVGMGGLEAQEKRSRAVISNSDT